MGTKTRNSVSYTTGKPQHKRLYIKHAESISIALNAYIRLLSHVSKVKIWNSHIQAVDGTLLLHIAC